MNFIEDVAHAFLGVSAYIFIIVVGIVFFPITVIAVLMVLYDRRCR